MYDVTITFANASGGIEVTNIKADSMEEAAKKAAEVAGIEKVTFYKPEEEIPEGKEVVARFKITTKGFLVHARER